jgi:hypothetical protein
MGNKIVLVACLAVSLSGCTTYELRTDNYNQLQPLPKTDPTVQDELTIYQPASKGFYPGYSYLTLESSIDHSKQTNDLFSDLDCSRGVSFDKDQKTFTMTATVPGQSGTYPLFSLTRDDTQNLCNIVDSRVSIGPLLKGASAYQLNVDIKSSMSDQIVADQFYTVIGNAAKAFALSGTGAFIGGAGQAASNTAIQALEKYISDNSLKSLGSTSTLLAFQEQDVRDGKLIYTGKLQIHKLKDGKDQNIDVGTLRVRVNTKLSLFPILQSVAMTSKDWADFDKRNLVPHLPDLPDYRGVNTWNEPVIPPGKTVPEPMSTAIDENEPVLANKVVPLLTALSGKDNADGINHFCAVIEGKLLSLGFTQPDTWAITAQALRTAPDFKTGPYYATVKNECFDEQAIIQMRLMRIPTGNDDPVLGGGAPAPLNS